MVGASLDRFPYEVIDLTHSINSQSPTWEGGCGFQHSLINFDADPSDVRFQVGRVDMLAGIGTHIDAPAHCIAGGALITDLSMQQLIAPLICIDISPADEMYQLSENDLQHFEERYGRVREGSFVMIHTGWERYWGQRDRYRNELRFPSVSEDAALALLDRGIIGLGIDTLSPDCGDSTFPVHRHFLSRGVYIVENLHNCGEFVQRHLFNRADVWVVIAPLKGDGLTEAPVRVFAFIPHAYATTSLE